MQDGEQMRAMVLEAPGQPLRLRALGIPRPGPGQVLLQVRACGVCRTDLHLVDGDLPHPRLPVIPGHEIVGIVVEVGPGADGCAVGDRVGVPWLGWTCGECADCREERENLCERALFTGYTRDGGYSEYAVADHRYCFALPPQYGDAAAAPLLCAGLIGYRSYRFIGSGVRRLGLYGFGAAAHLLAQVAVHEGMEVYAFTRPGDQEAQGFAQEMGATWTGPSDVLPPESLDAAVLFAPVGGLVPKALEAVRNGGTVVCGGIHMSDIPAFPYRLLWGERVLRSVANLTRRDGEEFLALAARVLLRTEIRTFALDQANEALDELRKGELRGAAVLEIRHP